MEDGERKAPVHYFIGEAGLAFRVRTDEPEKFIERGYQEIDYTMYRDVRRSQYESRGHERHVYFPAEINVGLEAFCKEHKLKPNALILAITMKFLKDAKKVEG